MFDGASGRPAPCNALQRLQQLRRLACGDCGTVGDVAVAKSAAVPAARLCETRMQGEARTDVFAWRALRLRLPSPVRLSLRATRCHGLERGEKKRQWKYAMTADGSAGARITCGQRGERGLFGAAADLLESQSVVRTSTPTTQRPRRC